MRRTLVVVGAVATVAALVGLPLRASYGARTIADEPQYLLTALSLWEDRSLDIDDELADERWRDFHEGQLPVQTEPLADGRQLSPHDPLLPLLLAAPVGLAGWAGAKATLALLAGALAALLTWTAHRRFAVPLRTAAIVVSAFAAGIPLSTYGAQVYPELPAALAVTVAVAQLAAVGRVSAPVRGQWSLLLAIVALPWLGVKYVPVAAALAAVALWQLRSRRRDLVTAVTVLAAAGVTYVVAHRVLYGGWTVYAAGDHFVGGEQTVVGTSPDYGGRTRRLLGLLVDRGFGLGAWAPGWLLVVPAVAVVVRRRPPAWTAVVVPLAAGWATATWVALTMHGWWFPGRQVVVVLPLAVLAVAWWAGAAPRVLSVVAVLGAIGAANWLWLAVEVARLDLRLVIDFEQTSNPLVRAWRLLLPELRSPTAGDWLRYVGWLAAGALSIHLTKGTSPCPEPPASSPPSRQSSPSASAPVATTTAATSAT